MAQNLLFITLAAVCVAVALAGPGGPHGGGPGGPGGPGGHGHRGGPSFLQNVTAAGRKEFEAVFRNETLTIAEQETQIAALADKYGVTAAYTEFKANYTAHLAEVKTNQTAVISNLSSVSASLATIYQNKNQTRKAQEEAVQAVRKEHPVEVAAIKFIRAELGFKPLFGGGRGPHGGPGGPGGHGGRGGRGGRGH